MASEDSGKAVSDTTGITQYNIPFDREQLVGTLYHEFKEINLKPGSLETIIKMIAAIYDIRTQPLVDRCKELYTYFNPDDTYGLPALPPDEVQKKEKDFYSMLEKLLNEADFTRITKEELVKSTQEEGLLPLSLNVNWDYFETVRLYYKGRSIGTEKVPHLVIPLLKKKVKFEYYNNFILVFKYREEEYFKKRKIKLKAKFGKIYIKYLVNVPCADIEMVFPGATPRITYFDKAKISIPILTCLGTVFYKYGLYPLFYYNQIPYYYSFERITKFDSPPLSLSAGMFALFVALISYSIKVYSSYKQTVQDILAKVTSTLYFKNIMSNLAVIRNLATSGVEENIKKTLLLYLFLVRSGRPHMAPELEKEIEEWFQNRHGIRVDFDSEEVLEAMEEIGLLRQSGDTIEVRVPPGSLIPHLTRFWHEMKQQQ